MEKIKKLYSKNPKELKDFIKELVDKIVSNYAEYIDFIILYGSAARGEFIKGSSDIDMVVQLNEKANKEIKEKLIQESLKWFWDLNEKYKLGFEKVIQTNIIEKVTPLYIPIFVFLHNDVDWINGKFYGPYKIVSLFTNEKSIFMSFKHEGLVLYGRDIRKEIKTKWTKWDKIRMITLPFWVINGALVLALFQPYKSKEYIIKALSYAILNTTHIYEKYDAITTEERIKVFAEIVFNNDHKKLEKIKEILSYKNKVDKVGWWHLFKQTYPLIWEYFFKILMDFRRW